MINIKLLRKLGLLMLVVVALALPVLLSQPSDATSASFQRLIDLGIIDGIRTPQELGLDYLQQEPVQLSSTEQLMASIQRAEQSVSQVDNAIPLKFQLDDNEGPVRIPDMQGELPPEISGSNGPNEAIGFADSSGQPRPLTSPDLGGMFETEAGNNGNLALTPSSQTILVADASRSFFQAKRVPYFNLIVHNKPTNRVYLVRKVNANAVCRDALNAVLKGRLARNTINLRNLQRS